MTNNIQKVTVPMLVHCTYFVRIDDPKEAKALVEQYISGSLNQEEEMVVVPDDATLSLHQADTKLETSYKYSWEINAIDPKEVEKIIEWYFNDGAYFDEDDEEEAPFWSDYDSEEDFWDDIEEDD